MSLSFQGNQLSNKGDVIRAVQNSCPSLLSAGPLFPMQRFPCTVLSECACGNTGVGAFQTLSHPQLPSHSRWGTVPPPRCSPHLPRPPLLVFCLQRAVGGRRRGDPWTCGPEAAVRAARSLRWPKHCPPATAAALRAVRYLHVSVPLGIVLYLPGSGPHSRVWLARAGAPLLWHARDCLRARLPLLYLNPFINW